MLLFKQITFKLTPVYKINHFFMQTAVGILIFTL